MDPSDRGWEEIKIAIALVLLATIAVILRFVARLVRRLKFASDDWFTLAGLVAIFGMLIEAILWPTIGGSGYHMETLTPDQIETFLKIFLANEFTYALTSPLVKLSIILFYRRLFTTRQFRLAANALIGAAVAWGVAVFLAAALQCRPLNGFWDESVDGHCFNSQQYFLGIQGVNIALDFAILCLPMPMVWNLQRPWQDKAALSVVFLLGAFVCSASIYRIITLFYIEDSDLTYTTYQGIIWTVVEPCIGLVCGCLPIIRGLFPAYTVRRGSSAKKSAPVSLPLRPVPGVGSDSYVTDVEYLKMDDTDRLVGMRDTRDKESYNGIRVKTTFAVE